MLLEIEIIESQSHNTSVIQLKYEEVPESVGSANEQLIFEIETNAYPGTQEPGTQDDSTSESPSAKSANT